MKEREEVWKKVPSYDGILASSAGDIYVEDYIATKDDGRTQLVKGGIRKPYKGKNGYLTIRYKSKLHYVHRLVCEAFYGKPSDGLVVNHKDANKLNNLSSNLEWCSYRDNNIHARESIRFKKPITGAEGRLCKLHPSQVLFIKNNSGLETEYKIGQKQLGEVFGVTQAAISSIVTGKNWGGSV